MNCKKFNSTRATLKKAYLLKYKKADPFKYKRNKLKKYHLSFPPEGMLKFICAIENILILLLILLHPRIILNNSWNYKTFDYT
jgi:hypothetical protein